MFDYNDLNRLQDANFYYATDPANFLSSQSYDVQSVSYDKSGNISGLTRRNESGAGAALTYNYRTGSNMLDWVQNLNNQAAGNYGYDNNGNIILDQAKELVDIQYDHRNMPLEIESELPDQLDLIDETITNTKICQAQNSISAESFIVENTGNVTFEAGTEIRLKPGFSTDTGSIFRADVDPDLVDATATISNRYDDSGSRVKKELETGPNFTYIRDLNGQTLAVLDENGVELFYNIYGLDLIGQYDVAASEEYYHLKDHLGNIRVTIDDNWNVLAYNDYYPFGLQMAGRFYNQGVANDFHKYSSKELDEETGLNWYYFGARFYDVEVDRWFVPDPLSDQYPSLSPFSYVGNNPLIFIDANGTEWFFYQAEGEDEAKWHFHEDTPEKKIWTGEYDEEGNKIVKTVKGLESLLSVEDGELVFRDAYGEIIPLGELDELEFPSMTQLYVAGKEKIFGPSEPYIGYIPFGPGGMRGIFNRLNPLQKRWFRKNIFNYFPSERGKGFVFFNRLRFHTSHFKYHGQHAQIDIFWKGKWRKIRIFPGFIWK